MLDLYAYDAVTNARVIGHAPIQVRCVTNGLVQARNSLMAHWLDKIESADWLFMIDTDMGFRPDVIDRLIEAADPIDRPVVGALCFGLKRDELDDGYNGYRTQPFPTLYRFGETHWGEPGFIVRSDGYPENTLLQVAGTGAACLLVHRSAAALVRETVTGGRPEWFDQIRYQSGTLVSEDLSFCYRLGRAGVPVFVHTGVRTTHAKQVWVGEEYYLQDQLFRKVVAGSPPPAVSIPDEELDDPAAIHARVALAGVPEVSDAD